MADTYDRYETDGAGAGFMMGLLAGTVLGAGLGMLLAPKAGAELRGNISEQARHLGSKASAGYRKASEQASAWVEKGREIAERAREAVVRGSQEVRGRAVAAMDRSDVARTGWEAGSGPAGGGAGSGYGGSSRMTDDELGRS